MDPVYEELRQHLDKHPAGAPEAPEILEILSSLFTPEEARVAVAAPFRPKSAAVIAERAHMSEEEARACLEALANKGLMFAREKEGEMGYAMLPIVPGVFEFPYMRGPKDETLRRLAPLWSSYLVKHAEEMNEIGTPLARVLPIQEEIEGQTQVLTYEKVYELIDEARIVGLSTCACRNAFSRCDGPLEACMVFDESCKYLVDRGFARYITKDEMKQKLREFDEAGLVHNVNNSQDKLQFICNCCPCCCGFMRAVREFHAPNFLASSGFVARVDEDLCSGCAICEDRCPVEAIEIVDEAPVVDLARCIGCGLCVTGCDTDAMELARRESMPDTPETMRDFGLRVLNARGKLEEFLAEM